MNRLAGLFKFLQNNNFKITFEPWHSVDIHSKNQKYSEYFYDVMEYDEVRNQAYRNVIHGLVKGKTVVEIGTGKALFLTRMCVESGARMVYTIEENDTAFESSEKLIKELGLQDKIKIYHGFSSDVTIPEKGDVFVHELIGDIATNEGLITTSIDAKERFLKPDATFIPCRCDTLISPVSAIDKSFGDMAANYILKKFGFDGSTSKFEENNSYSMYNFPLENLIAPPKTFEEIIFKDELITEEEREVEWQINKEADFNGFVLFLKLFLDEDHVVNSLTEKMNWTVTYVRLLPKNIKLHDGDRLHAKIYRNVSKESPIYTLSTTIIRNNKVIFQKNDFAIE